MAAGVALKVANLGSLVRSAQAPRFSEGSMSLAGTANIIIMIKSIRDVRKYVRQQRPAKPGEPITVRLHPDQLNQLKAWIAKQDDAPSRPEAMRRLLAKALGKK